MVYLYGVIHGGRWNDFLTGSNGEIEIFPTAELITDLSRFPRGTRVGLESMSKEDWEDVRAHIVALPFNPPEPRFEDRRFVPQPFYREGAFGYWDKLVDVCTGSGFDVVFLDDKNLWFKYNKAIVQIAENEVRRSNLLVKEKGESDEYYDRKRIGFNLDRCKEEISARRIHEIDRDTQLLQAIKSLKVDVAFVGLGHSDYWMANPLITSSKFGLNFEGYSTEVPRMDAHKWEGLIIFNKDTEPNLRNAFIRDSLERAIRLVETGKLTERKPTFVGTWDIHNPLEGYFEMFVEKDGGIISGEIVDCLGDANFEGKIPDGTIRFVKRYMPGKCSDGASLKDITYKGIVREGNVIGYFVIDGFGKPFYATQKQEIDFIDLGMSWIHSSERYEEDMKSLKDRLFSDND